MAMTSRLFVSFGEQGMGLLPATLGIGSDGIRRRLLKHLRPLYPAPVAWRLGHLAPHITKNDTAGEVLEALVRSIDVMKIPPIAVEVPHASSDVDRTCAT
jgi:hypothetical protein